MEAALAKLLVDEGGIPADRLDEAVRRSAQQGGRLDTHLLELGLIDEARLTQLLARAHGLPAADFRALVKVDLQALRLLPARVAERCQVFPFLLDGRELHVLAPAPPDLVLLEEIGELVGHGVVPHVATEYRIARALAHFYGLPVPARFASLERVLQGRPPANAAAAVPASTPAPAAPPASSPRWPLDTALARLASAQDREAVLDVALSYARSFAECVAALGVHTGRAVGWRAVGVTPEREELPGLSLTLEEPSALRTVLDTAAPYLGKFGAGPVHDGLLAALGRPRPRSVLLYPVLVAGRVIALLYADNGKFALRTADLADLLAFGARIGAAFENVILARKREGSTAAQATTTTPAGDRVEDSATAATPGASPADAPPPVETAPAAADVTAEAEPAPRVLTVQVEVEAAAPAMTLFEDGETSAEPTAPPAEDQVAATTARDDQDTEATAEELASWDEEAVATLGTAGVRPAAAASADHLDLAATLSEDDDRIDGEEDVALETGIDDALGFGEGTGFESGEESLPIRALPDAQALLDKHAPVKHDAPTEHDALDEALAEAASAVDDEEPAPTPAPGAATAAADTAPSPAEAPAAAAPGDPWDDDADAHPDEERVVLEELDEPEAVAPWRDALVDAVETERQDGEVPPPAGSVLAIAAPEVALAEIVSEVVAPRPAPTVVEDASPSTSAPADPGSGAELELGTPRAEPSLAKPQAFSLADLHRLCELLAGPDCPAARQAMRELQRADLRLIPMLTARFPGRVSYDPFAQNWSIPEPEDLSPLLALLVARPDIGAEVALSHLDSSFPALRWFAVYLFRYVHDGRAIKAILSRLHDEEPRIRHLTAEVLKTYAADVGFELVIKHLRSRLQSPVAEVRRRAIYFLGFFKDVSSVPHLVGCLSAREPELVAEAVQALAAVTLQTLGSSQRKWLRWWQKNQARSRVEWLIDGLRHKDRNIRYAASVELTAMARETFGYDHDGKRRDRDRAIKAWERWWKAEKKRMHIDA